MLPPPSYCVDDAEVFTSPLNECNQPLIGSVLIDAFDSRFDFLSAFRLVDSAECRSRCRFISRHLTTFLGEMQRIAFRLLLSTCVCVCVCLCVYVSVGMCVCVSVYMPRLWTPGKRFEVDTSFF